MKFKMGDKVKYKRENNSNAINAIVLCHKSDFKDNYIDTANDIGTYDYLIKIDGPNQKNIFCQETELTELF